MGLLHGGGLWERDCILGVGSCGGRSVGQPLREEGWGGGKSTETNLNKFEKKYTQWRAMSNMCSYEGVGPWPWPEAGPRGGSAGKGPPCPTGRPVGVVVGKTGPFVLRGSGRFSKQLRGEFIS